MSNPHGKYLGTTPIDVSTHPVYSKYTPTDWAMNFITRYSGIDGSHHQMWIVDQVARILKGTPVLANSSKWEDGYTEDWFVTGEPSDEYIEWVEYMLGDTDEHGEREYSYDCGIAP